MIKRTIGVLRSRAPRAVRPPRHEHTTTICTRRRDDGSACIRLCRPAKDHLTGASTAEARASKRCIEGAAAALLASGGASLPLIGSLLGHRSASSTSRYAHHFMDPQRRALEAVAAALNFDGATKTATVLPHVKRH